MLAFASGTIEIIAGDSGAGERIPALAQEASRPGSARSNTATFNPDCASSKAMEEPMSPAPAIATSKDFIWRFYLIRVAHSFCAIARVDRFSISRSERLQIRIRCASARLFLRSIFSNAFRRSVLPIFFASLFRISFSTRGPLLLSAGGRRGHGRRSADVVVLNL